MTVKSFTGDLDFLSNFYKRPFWVPQLSATVPTGEHAYQAFKTADPAERDWILAADGPRRAKHRGARVHMREDWSNGGRVWAMMQTLSAKFADPVMESALYDTDGPLVEGNYWHDNYWGVCSCDNCPGHGQNMLGELLMMRRALRNSW